MLTNTVLTRPRLGVLQTIFADLARAGVEQASLQLAWEFRTESLEGTTGWIVAMRDDANVRVPASGPPYEIVSVQDDVNAEYVHVYRE